MPKKPLTFLITPQEMLVGGKNHDIGTQSVNMKKLLQVTGFFKFFFFLKNLFLCVMHACDKYANMSHVMHANMCAWVATCGGQRGYWVPSSITLSDCFDTGFLTEQELPHWLAGWPISLWHPLTSIPQH